MESLKATPENSELGNVRTGLETYLSPHSHSMSPSHLFHSNFNFSLSLVKVNKYPFLMQRYLQRYPFSESFGYQRVGRDQGSARPLILYPMPQKS